MIWLVISFIFFAVAYNAEYVCEQWPVVTHDLGGGVRGIADDFGAGDPYKIVHYEPSVAQIMVLNYEAATIKYPLQGYLITTGVSARCEEERALLRHSRPGMALNVYYDAANPTIVVMQPTYFAAMAKMKLINKRKTTNEPRRHKVAFMPGSGKNNPNVLPVRVISIVMGFVFFYLGTRKKQDWHD